MSIVSKLETMNRVAPAGTATARALAGSADGILIAYGTTVPADASVGYAPGCLFIHVDGSGYAAVLYCNVGTKASADFNVVTVAS